MSSQHRTLAAAVVVSLATLTSCGGGGFADESAADIQKAAVSDMKSLESVRLSGTVEEEDGELALDLQLNKSGECQGTVKQGGGTAEFVSVGGSSYLKGDETFWAEATGSDESAQQVLQMLGDKWALIPSDDSDFSEVCDLDELLSELDDGNEGKKGKETEVDGEDAIEITSKSEDGGTTRGYVAIDEPHYLLKVDKTGGDEPGSFTFSDFDEELAVEAPAEEDVVDLQAP